MREPTVLHVGNFLSHRGRSRQVIEELSDRLEVAGWSVIRTSRIHWRPARLADMLLTIWRLRRRFDVAQIDVFSGSAFRWAECAAAFVRRTGKPSVLALHGGNLPEFQRRRPMRVRRLLEGAIEVVAPSRYLQAALRESRDDITVIPNAIELRRYRFRLRSRPQPRLVWVRHFRSIYNAPLAVEVLACTRRLFPDARLVMCGGDSRDGTLEEVKRTVRAHALESAVRITGAVPKHDVPSVLQEGDVFINTTNVDNTPVSVIEAMACGLPVVSTRVGGIPCLLDEGRTGLLVPSDDPGAMAEAVRRLLTESGLACRLSVNGRSLAAAMDWEPVLGAWMTLLRQAAEARVP